MLFNIKYMEYNYISLGDHCVSAELIQHIGMRKASYPFDWNIMLPMVQTSSITYNMEILNTLMKTHQVKDITRIYIGNALNSDLQQYRMNRLNNHYAIWFPHESGTRDEIVAKYERRFERLYNDVQTKQNVFVICSRCVQISQDYFDNVLLTTLLGYNPANKIIFISGSNHEYLAEDKYKTCVLFKHVRYDFSGTLDDYDPIFRKNIRDYLDTFQQKFFE